MRDRGRDENLDMLNTGILMTDNRYQGCNQACNLKVEISKK